MFCKKSKDERLHASLQNFIKSPDVANPFDKESFNSQKNGAFFPEEASGSATKMMAPLSTLKEEHNL